MKQYKDTLIAISGYSGDAECIKNNLVCHMAHECPIVILSPEDARIENLGIEGIDYRYAGKKGWIGQHTLDRQREFLKIMYEYNCDYYLFNDADSLCLSPQLPKYLYKPQIGPWPEPQEVFWSNEVPDMNPGKSDLPKLAFQPPYFFSRGILKRLIDAEPAKSFYV